MWTISGTAEARAVKFCTQVGCVKSKHIDDKSHLKGAWSRSRDRLPPKGMCSESRDLINFGKHIIISRKRCKMETSHSCSVRLIRNCMWPIEWHHYRWHNCDLEGHFCCSLSLTYFYAASRRKLHRKSQAWRTKTPRINTSGVPYAYK